MAHFEAHRQFMDAIAPRYGMQDHEDWKAFMHDSEWLMTTLDLKMLIECRMMSDTVVDPNTGDLVCRIVLEYGPKITRDAFKKIVDDKVDTARTFVQGHLDKFTAELRSIAKQRKCSLKVLTDEINDSALKRFPNSPLLGSRAQTNKFGHLCVYSMAYMSPDYRKYLPMDAPERAVYEKKRAKHLATVFDIVKK